MVDAQLLLTASEYSMCRPLTWVGLSDPSFISRLFGGSKWALHYKGVGNGGDWGFKLMLLCVYKQLLQKDIQNLEKQERKKQPLGYKYCYT